MDVIFVEAIEFYGYHGASDEEQHVGHRYTVDVELWVDTARAGQSDDLSDTVNYAAVARRIVSVGTETRFRLVEALAERMAGAILDEFPVESVRLRVRKVTPPMRAIAAAAGVVIERHRAS